VKSPISSCQISVGISIRHGPPRPLRSFENARRSAFGISFGSIRYSEDFVTSRIFWAEEKLGSTPAMRRG
jgi:hypothetical protein